MARSKAWLRILLVLVALAGAGVSLFLQSGSLGGRAGAAFARACGSGPRFDCSSALSSRWGKIGPFPTATWGLAYFSFVALWYAIAGLPNRAGRRWHFVPLGAVCVGVVLSCYFLFVMFAVLPAACPWCIAAHALNFVLFAGTLLGWPRGESDGGEAARPNWRQAATVAAIGAAWLVAIVASLTAWYYWAALGAARGAYFEATNNVDYVVWRHGSARRMDVSVRGDDVIAGATRAPHTLVIFTDFECPHCAEIEGEAAKLLNRYPGRLQMVFKQYPMSRACSKELPARQDVHRFACEAARAAEAARATGTPQQAWKYRQLLFQNTENFAAGPWEALAAQVGIDPSKFAAAMASPATAARVAEDVRLGRALEIDGSGAMFLDGKRLPAWRISTTEQTPRTDEMETWRLWDRLVGRAGAAGAITSAPQG